MLILGSSSIQRKILLNNAGIVIDKIIAPNIDERILKNEPPKDYVKRIALKKQSNIKINHDDFLVTADTIVVKGRRILTKPKNIEEARLFLTLLSGSRHRVITCVYVSHNKKERFKIVQTVIKFKRFSYLELKSYLNSNEWRGKAGGYAIQGLASRFCVFLSGSYTNAVGLPIYETFSLLNGLGYQEKQKI